MKMNSQNRWKLASSAYVLCCALVDLFPHFGAPFFRYTGSDPAVHVWNLGWPFALFIFDSRAGLQIGPFVAPVIGIQLVLIGLASALYFTRMNRQNNTSELTSGGRADASPRGSST